MEVPEVRERFGILDCAPCVRDRPQLPVLAERVEGTELGGRHLRALERELGAAEHRTPEPGRRTGERQAGVDAAHGGVTVPPVPSTRMEVTVRLFAMLRERAGQPELTLDLPDGARVGDALAQLHGLAEGVPLVMAVNREYADEERVLDPGDELALIPPVSGGEARAAPWVRVSAEPLSLDSLAERVRDPRAGAVVTFQGVTREVERLEYEAYAEMAEQRLATIAADAVERHGLCAAAVEHRVGEVPLTEPSVIVAASAPHRGEAFAGAREIIDRVKAEAPIWKKEVEGAEERWVEGRPPSPRQ